MKKTLLPFLILPLLFVSCGRSAKRADSAKDLARAIVEALRAGDVEQLLPYHISQKEAKEFIDDFVEDDEDHPLLSFTIPELDDYDLNSGEKKDKGFSESQLSRFFENDLGRFRKDFKSVLDDGKEKDINWSKVKFTKIEEAWNKKRKRGDKPTWIRIWCSEGKKTFYVFVQNAVKTEKGWTCGLSLKLSDEVRDDGMSVYDIFSSPTNQQKRMDSTMKADSMAKLMLEDSVAAAVSSMLNSK